MVKNEKAADLAMLARIKTAIKAMPTFPPVGTIVGDAVQQKTLAVRDASDAFRKQVGPDFERLAILRARLLPDALLPGPCGYGRGAHELTDPVVHYAWCYDLCGLCREEALREVDELARAMKRGRRGPVFLPPHVAQGRIAAANESRIQRRTWTAPGASRNQNMAGSPETRRHEAGAPASFVVRAPVSPTPRATEESDPTDTMIISWLRDRRGRFTGEAIARGLKLKHGTIRKNLSALKKSGALHHSRKLGGYSFPQPT